jgi:hypothetical protein
MFLVSCFQHFNNISNSYSDWIGEGKLDEKDRGKDGTKKKAGEEE